MNKRVIIFTDNYPFGRSEPFLDAELQYIEQPFEKVILFPIAAGRERRMRSLPGKVEVMRPIFNDLRNKPELIIKGIFNRSLFFKLIKEGIGSRVWRSGARFRIWATHFLVIRGILAEIQKRELINVFNESDILYFYWGIGWSQVLPFLPAGIKPKIVVRFHGSDLYEHINRNYIPWRNEQLSGITKAVAISSTGKKYIEDHYPFLRDRIILSRIGTKDYGINPWKKSGIVRIISCSNLVPVKRVGLIISVITRLKCPVEWIHFGDGPQMRQIRLQSETLPSHIRAELKGFVEHDTIMKYMGSTSIDLFINVSSSEGVPVSVMEAMSFGIPVIATNAGGTSEIVSEKTGLLLDVDFVPEELATCIESFVSRMDPEQIRKTSREEWEKISKAENVYPEFINKLLSL
jgi:colanic acid/amylovoran biosynthesis glycosyltransferase